MSKINLAVSDYKLHFSLSLDKHFSLIGGAMDNIYGGRYK